MSKALLRHLSEVSASVTRAPRHRLAFIVSHPIQYYVPLYQRLSRREDIAIKVFFTWHDGTSAVQDRGFGIPFAWDIPLNDGYEFELIKNVSADPGTHHFWGLRNPSLTKRVLGWEPTIAHVTGWAWASHLQALRSFKQAGLPTLFRGDSHLLDSASAGPRWWAKKALLSHIYRWPTGFLVTGKANYDYYRAFEVPPEKLWPCPHSIDYARFAEPDQPYEEEARRWRRELNIAEDRIVLLFAGKFDTRKDPVGFMRAVVRLANDKVVAVMIGAGELQSEIDQIAKDYPNLFRVLPFQNQQRMPIVYRLGELFVLPSKYGETWGLAVNEALASGRPVLVSDKVGCAADVVDSTCGYVFGTDGEDGLFTALRHLTREKAALVDMRLAARTKARLFDTSVTGSRLMDAIASIDKLK
jgi:glycosyltransferase involved in cell wall biosynthesis